MEGGQVNRLLVEHDNECDLSCLVYFECILVVSNNNNVRSAMFRSVIAPRFRISG